METQSVLRSSLTFWEADKMNSDGWNKKCTATGNEYPPMTPRSLHANFIPLIFEFNWCPYLSLYKWITLLFPEMTEYSVRAAFHCGHPSWCLFLLVFSLFVRFGIVARAKSLTTRCDCSFYFLSPKNPLRPKYFLSLFASLSLSLLLLLASFRPV